MRLLLVLVAAAVLASGCAGLVRVDRSQVTCVNGECEVCVDGECAACDEEECEECRDGDCAAFDLARDGDAPGPVPLADVGIQETHSLAQGLPSTTWTFEVAAGAAGHARWTLRDLATRSVVVSGNVCLQWGHVGPGSESGGSRGNCGSGFAVVSGTTTDRPMDLVAWDSLKAGTYTVTASGPPQGNELVVDVVVDNP